MNIDESRKLTIENALSTIDEEIRFCRALRSTLSGLNPLLKGDLCPREALRNAAWNEGICGNDDMEKFFEWADTQIRNAIDRNLLAAWKAASANGPGEEIDKYNALRAQTKYKTELPLEILKEACQEELDELNSDEEENCCFQTGKKYYTRSVGDYNCIYEYTVVSRTEKTITLSNPSFEKPQRKKVYLYEGVEHCRPEGSYSMAPILGADKIQEEEPVGDEYLESKYEEQTELEDE